MIPKRAIPPAHHALAPLLAVALALAPQPGHAAEAATPPPPPEDPPATEKGYTPKRRSSFDIGDLSRNPFWPIGWQPGKPAAVEEKPVAPTVDPSLFRVTSISISSGQARSSAIVNGAIREEGETFIAKINGTAVPVTVTAVRDGIVTFSSCGASFQVPLGRR